MNLEELLQEAKDGNMVAQYDLAEQFGKRLKETDRQEDIREYSRQAVYWLKQSAKQGYGPAVDAVRELNIQLGDTEDLLEQIAAEYKRQFGETPDNLADAVEALENNEPVAAKKLLIAAMREAEERVVSAEEVNDR